jgi:hypothetical protein
MSGNSIIRVIVVEGLKPKSYLIPDRYFKAYGFIRD